MLVDAVEMSISQSVLCWVLLPQELLGQAVDQTDGAEVESLEKLYALLAQCIYRHRKSYDKTHLLQVALHVHTAGVLFLLLLLPLFTSPLCFFVCFFDRKCEQRSTASPEHQHLNNTQCVCCCLHPSISKYLIISIYS